MAKILVVEDDEEISGLIRDVLAVEHHTVECVVDGKEALERLRFYKYDMAIMDWNLPGLPGIEICSQYRTKGGTIPILILTGRTDVLEREAGLDSGADDYLTKPFHMRELSARVRALLRRSGQVSGNILTAGRVKLDPQTFRVHVDDVEVRLLPKEFALLEFLMRNKNQVFSVNGLLDHVWADGSESSVDALRQCLARLRKKIDKDGEESLITTVVGRGYTIKE